MIAGDTHPDHGTLCAFRRNNLALIHESFVRVLEMAAQLKVLKVVQITGVWKIWSGSKSRRSLRPMRTRPRK